MSTSIIDGSVEEVKLKHARPGMSIYDSIRFKLDDGSSRTITKAVLKQEVADTLQPGSHGRFYLFSAFDMKGVHGVRRGDTAVYGFPGNNARLFMILGIVNILWIALKLSTEGRIPGLAMALLVLALVGYYLMSKGQTEAKKQFDGDGAYTSPAAVAASAPAP